MREVAVQWLRAVRAPDFRQSDDFLAVAAGHLSGPALDLADALRRLQAGATVFSQRQCVALKRLKALLLEHGASDGDIDVILARAVILPLQVESPQQEHAERGRLLLDGRVVRPGDGARAWRELLGIAGDAACSQLTYSVEGWLEQLRRRHVRLISDDRASRAAYLESRARAVARYRERLQRRGEYVDLTSIGLPIAPIRLREMDVTIDVRTPDADEQDSKDLFWSVRLHGRVVLTGLPGSGKSTAIARIVSQWARRDHWALPITAALRRLAEKERFRRRPLRDEILTLATEMLDPEDRPLVRDALEDALGRGHAALFLDGLDEAADRSLDLTRDISEMLRDVHEDTDVLVATRDVAYADAQILGFRDLRLCRPGEAGRAVAAVLHAIAVQKGARDADGWAEQRAEWVRRVMAADSQLRETPLIPILLASVAADCGQDELPDTRSRILQEVVRGVVGRRELARDVRITGVSEGHRADVALGAFPIVASALETAGGSARRDDLVRPVGRYLQREWGLPPGAARSTAGELLVFWDEAGIFVAMGPTKVVSPRLHLFLEIGAAWRAASMSARNAVSWVEDRAGRTNRGETLVLAAGLSKVVAGALIDRACREQGPLGDRLAAEAAQGLAEGGTGGTGCC